MAEATRAQSLPAGVIVHGTRAELASAFSALAALQPVRWCAAGLICAPRAAPELARPALERCPLPHSSLDRPPGWPTPAAAIVAGWYRRGPDHAPAPLAIPELVQCDGEGFGPLGHPTTTMCLLAIATVAAAPAIDAGCGSGLLAQAWAHLHRRLVLALDADPRAVHQCRRSVGAAGLGHLVEVRRAQIDHLTTAEMSDRVVLANLPLAGHRQILARMVQPPPAAIVSGVDARGAAEIVAEYRRLGLRVVGARQRGRWQQRTMVRQ